MSTRAASAAFGSGGTGGGNAVLLAAVDDRVKASCRRCRSPMAATGCTACAASTSGRVPRPLEADRARVLTGEGEMVRPREGIMVATPERQATKVKADVDDRIPSLVPLRCAEAILAYKPIDVAHLVIPAGR